MLLSTKLDIILSPMVGEVQVVGLRRVFGSHCVDLLYSWTNVEILSQRPHLHSG